VGLFALSLIFIFYLSRPNAFFSYRIGRALGDTAFFLLFLTLIIGPLSKLSYWFLKLIDLRRELGIWFAAISFLHFLQEKSVFGITIENIEQPHLLGLIALFWAIILALTSSDRAVNFLAPSSWKWLHSMAYVIFYLIIGHASFYLFWYNPNTNWFRHPFLIMSFLVPILQIGAFIKEVIRNKKGQLNLEEQNLKLPILEQKLIAENTCEVSLDLSGQNFQFIPGQYIRLTLPKLLYPDAKGASRVFSVASSPDDKKISIAFRQTQSGFKKTIMELKPGSLVYVEGPFGYFTLPKKTSRPLVFIAGGIGITPFMSMLFYNSKRNLDYKITLLYGNKNKESAAYLNEIEEIAKTNSKISVKNKFGPIDEEFIKENVKDIKESLWYIAGPPNLVASIKNLLLNLAVEEKNIFHDDFEGY